MKISLASIAIIIVGLIFAVKGLMSSEKKKRILGILIIFFIILGIGKDLGWWMVLPE